MYHLTNLLFFHIPLSYYYNNLRSSLICCYFFRDISAYFLVFPLIFLLFVNYFAVNYSKFYKQFNYQPKHQLLLLFSYSFWSNFTSICSRLFTKINVFDCIYHLRLYLYFYQADIAHIFSKRQKSIAFYRYLQLQLNSIFS